MVHLELGAVCLDGIRDFFHHLSFHGSCHESRGGGPLMTIHGDQWVSRFKENKFSLESDQEMDHKFFDSIPEGPGVSASTTSVTVTHRNRHGKTVRGQKGTSTDGPLVRGTDPCSWKNPKKTACPGV